MSEPGQRKCVLMGYMPLFDYKSFMIESEQLPGTVLDDTTVIDKVLGDEQADTTVHGVAWLRYPDPSADKVIPVFIMDRGLDIAKHMTDWIDGEPNRFILMAHQYDHGYALSLVPDPQKSIERHRAARLLYHGQVDDTIDYIVCYQHIGVYCPGDRFASLVDSIGSSTEVGFVDKAEIEDQSKEPEMTILGPFVLAQGHDRHLNSFLPEEYVQSEVNDA